MNFINTQSGEYPISFAQLRAAHPLTMFPEGFSEAFGDYAPVQPAAAPARDEAKHKVVELAPVQQGGQWVQVWALAPHPVELLRANLLAAVAQRRWEVETGGITLPGGARIATGIDDQNRITSVIANAQIAGVASVDFKAADGWVTLTLSQLHGIAAAVALHVQACFAAERAHHDAVMAATEEELLAYDIGQGWPGGAA